ncbi:carbon storage regulator CsrA [Acetomicrobium hydrogeniformans]|uniref:Translational regulator CsrA n=1 Tax=Acetomicrobium hydrogeniformans ATCC BAA-1850 TaxID=592015 RepID=A0A0T5XBA3_9BACT|nr:carbon storage regulator CsrA [Acetomicrobium hydrogeniformans]KRT35644.1 carbon storage regulator [Acetomicrobium hydrogeniformans ATCC BAA-1850]
MLVLSRKEGESLMLNDTIEVMVVEIGKGQVRLGIRAPKDVLILRKELTEEVALSNKLSAKTKDLHVLGSLMKKSNPNNDS